MPYPYSCEDIQSRCSNDLEKFVVRGWGEMIDKWDASGRGDEEYRRIFENIQKMLNIYQSASVPVVENVLLGKLKYMFGIKNSA